MYARIDTNMYGVWKQTCYAVVQNFILRYNSSQLYNALVEQELHETWYI